MAVAGRLWYSNVHHLARHFQHPGRRICTDEQSFRQGSPGLLLLIDWLIDDLMIAVI